MPIRKSDSLIAHPVQPSHGSGAPGGLSPTEVVIAIFKHKWKVIFCTLAGITGAILFWYLNPPLYQSDAKLLVRYMVERSAVDPVQGSNADASDKPSDNVLNSEAEIMSSWDLYEQVADQVGVNRLCPNMKDATNIDAARVIQQGLSVSVLPKTNVILASYRNGDPQLAPLVLQSLLDAYLRRHLEIHRSAQAYDTISREVDMLKAELLKTEDDLKKKLGETNIISLQATANNLNTEDAETQQQLNTTSTELAEELALVQQLETALGVTPTTKAQTDGTSARAAGTGAGAADGAAKTPATSGTQTASEDDVQKYQGVVAEIAELRKKDIDLRANYLPESSPMKANQAALTDLEAERHSLEKQHPELVQQAPAGGSPTHGADLVAERARLAALEARMQSLQTRQRNIEQRAREFAREAPEIEELQRNKQMEQTELATSQTKLASAMQDEELDPSKIPNISVAQKPPVGMMVVGTRQKVVIGMCVGGLAAGLLLAAAIEMAVGNIIKRPMELEQRMGIPLALSIPFFTGKARKALPGRANGKELATARNGAGTNGQAVVPAWETSHFVRPYAEAIRDSLGVYFDVNNITHKPKLLAVVGLSEESGASTLAAGIAAALSETGEGKILLVDMNSGHTGVHPFFKGRPACSLAQALSQEGPPTPANDNLYLATTTASENGGGSIGLKRFQELIPYLNASNFDYVLFDMQPLSQTSPTSAMTAFMDKVFLVVEAEKSQRDVLKRGYAQLMARKADVSVILNKVRSYAPRWIEGGI